MKTIHRDLIQLEGEGGPGVTVTDDKESYIKKVGEEGQQKAIAKAEGALESDTSQLTNREKERQESRETVESLQEVQEEVTGTGQDLLEQVPETQHVQRIARIGENLVEVTEKARRLAEQKMTETRADLVEHSTHMREEDVQEEFHIMEGEVMSGYATFEQA